MGNIASAKIAALAEENQLSMVEAMNKVIYSDDKCGVRLSKAAFQRLADLPEFFDRIQTVAVDNMIAEIATIITREDVPVSADEETNQERLTFENIIEALMNEATRLRGSPKEFIEYAVLERDNSGDFNNHVQVMTIHAAKGLEWDNVVVAGLNEYILPYYTSIMMERRGDETAIEEDRRKAYVAITRARHRLALTYSVTKFNPRSNETLDRSPSRFILESNL